MTCFDCHTNGHTNGYGHVVTDDKVMALERKIKELETLIERKAYREEELESELDRLRGASSMHSQDKHKSASSVLKGDRDVLETFLGITDTGPRRAVHAPR